MNRAELLKNLTEETMLSRGFDKDKHPKEWDMSLRDSQISMIYEDVEHIVSLLEKEGAMPRQDENFVKWTQPEGGSFNQKNNYTYGATEKKKQPSITTNAYLDVYATDPTVAELSTFIDRLKALEVKDEERLKGVLYYSIDIGNTAAECIECGECGSSDYLVAKTAHPCISSYDK